MDFKHFKQSNSCYHSLACSSAAISPSRLILSNYISCYKLYYCVTVMCKSIEPTLILVYFASKESSFLVIFSF